MYKVIAFDFDGTIVDSMGAYAIRAAQILQDACAVPFEVAKTQYLRTSGLPFRVQSEIIAPNFFFHDMLDQAFTRSKEKILEQLPPEKTTRELLEWLHKQNIVCVISSNNTPELLQEFITRHDLAFDGVYGYESETFQKGKPHITAIKEKYTCTESEILMVGDSLKDAEKARECGVDFVGKLGTFDEESFRAAGVSHIVNNLMEMSEIVSAKAITEELQKDPITTPVTQSESAPERKKRKVCVVLINRANYGRLKSVLTAIKEHPDLELQIIAGSSMLIYRYGRSVDVVRADGFTVDGELYMQVEGENPLTMAKSVGLAFIELPSLFDRLKPDVVLVNADRYETIAIATCAQYMNIPVAHTLGGENTGTIDDYVRHAVTKLSDIHFTAHDAAAHRVKQMGEHPERVHVMGNPSLDVLRTLDKKIINEEFWSKYGGTGVSIDVTKPFILSIFHPVTTEYGKNYENTKQLLNALDEVGLPVIMLWPNNDAGSDEVTKAMRERKEKGGRSLMHFLRNMQVEDYLRLMANAACVVGNSSSGIMEAGFLGVGAVDIGSRQRGREMTHNVIHIDGGTKEIVAAIQEQIGKVYEPDYLFGDGYAGKKVAEILATIDVSTRKSFHETAKEKQQQLAL